MGIYRKARRMECVFFVLLIFLSPISCAITKQNAQDTDTAAPSQDANLKMQALVMDMADDYLASLGESVYLLVRSGKLDSKGRWLAQSFLRNGVGASLDIAVGPNPSVSLLDLLVLTSLQAWSFEAHWIPAGIGDAGIPALDRLKRAEEYAWTSAKKVLSEDQLITLRELISAWISENPDRTVVALVRFNEFDDERKISSLSLRGKAQGLLKEVSEASAVVDEARLLGERLLWFAGRYPYLLGEQAELTAYRLIDQPESTQIVEALKSVQALSESLSKNIETMQSDLEKQQAALFSRVSQERKATLQQFFDRLSQERAQFLDNLLSQEDKLGGVMTRLEETVKVSLELANELTQTAKAVDKVVSHFDEEPGKDREPLRITDVRDAAIETGRAAKELTGLLKKAIDLMESKSLDQKISILTDPGMAIVDRAFWRGFILILLLIVALALLRILPQRNTDLKKISGT